jgi:HSP20 family protein
MAKEKSSPSFQPTYYPPPPHPEVWGEKPLTDLEEKQRRLDENLGRMLRSVYWGPHFVSHERHRAPEFQPTYYPLPPHPEVWGEKPLTDLEDMSRHYEDALGRVIRPELWRRFPIQETHWAPPVEIFERGDKVVIKFEIPGMKAEDVDVTIVGDRLVAKGERKSETDVKDEDYYICERCYGKCSRTVALPTYVDAEKVEATFEDGVLEVIFPKTAEAKAKKIPVPVKKKATK